MSTAEAVRVAPGPQLADLVRILIHPRQTMRRILDATGDRWGVQIVVLAFLCASVNDADMRRIGVVLPGLQTLPLVAIAALALIAGAIGWLIVLFLLTWVVTLVGRLMGGQARTADIRTALGWSIVPIIWSPIYRVPLFISALELHIKRDINLTDAVLNFFATGGLSLVVIFLTFQLLFAIACLALAGFTIAEAERLPTEKGFAVEAITLALPVVVGIALVVAYHH